MLFVILFGVENNISGVKRTFYAGNFEECTFIIMRQLTL